MQAERKRRVRIAAEIDRDLVALVDRERKGRCSRAAIIRMAIMDRYRKGADATPKLSREVRS